MNYSRMGLALLAAAWMPLAVAAAPAPISAPRLRGPSPMPCAARTAACDGAAAHPPCRDG